MKIITRDKVIYMFGPNNFPVAEVAVGEEFWVETRDCYSGQIKTEADLRPNINTAIMNAATGPISIRSIKHGDVICIDILEIELAEYGIMPTNPGLGLLGNLISEPNTKIIPIKDGKAYFSSSIKIPLEPMIGVIGVSPASEDIHCVIPGDHGANMDTKDIKAGSKVYLPVFVDGANLAIADLHACMGDGELCGTGIEIAGRVRLSVSRIEGLSLLMPIVESEDHFIIIASGKEFMETSKKAIKYSAELIGKSLGVSFPDAYRLVSAACDLKVSQIVNPLITVRVAIPKFILPVLS